VWIAHEGTFALFPVTNFGNKFKLRS